MSEQIAPFIAWEPRLESNGLEFGEVGLFQVLGIEQIEHRHPKLLRHLLKVLGTELVCQRACFMDDPVHPCVS